MSWKEEYDKKMMDIKEAVKLIEDGDVLWVGTFCNNPVQMIEALEERKDELHNVTIVNNLACQPFK